MTFFPFKQAPKPYLVSENRRYFHASERSCCPITLTHISLSLCICSVSVQCAHIPPTLSLSLRLSAQFLFSARTHISLSLYPRLLSFCSASHTHLSLSASAQFLFSTRTHISLSLSLSLSLSTSAQFLFSMRTHTSLSLSLSLSLSASAQFLFSVPQRRAVDSVKHRYYVACFFIFFMQV